MAPGGRREPRLAIVLSTAIALHIDRLSICPPDSAPCNTGAAVESRLLRGVPVATAAGRPPPPASAGRCSLSLLSGLAPRYPLRLNKPVCKRLVPCSRPLIRLGGLLLVLASGFGASPNSTLLTMASVAATRSPQAVACGPAARSGRSGSLGLLAGSKRTITPLAAIKAQRRASRGERPPLLPPPPAAACGGARRAACTAVQTAVAACT